jgi:hypothetical protein
MTWWNAVLPVVTLILGYVGTLWTEERRDARALERARTERQESVATAKGDRRESFELETLARAHTAISDFGRAVGRLHHVDSMIAKTSGEYASHTGCPKRTPTGTFTPTGRSSTSKG